MGQEKYVYVCKRCAKDISDLDDLVERNGKTYCKKCFIEKTNSRDKFRYVVFIFLLIPPPNLSPELLIAIPHSSATILIILHCLSVDRFFQIFSERTQTRITREERKTNCGPAILHQGIHLVLPQNRSTTCSQPLQIVPLWTAPIDTMLANQRNPIPLREIWKWITTRE